MSNVAGMDDIEHTMAMRYFEAAPLVLRNELGELRDRFDLALAVFAEFVVKDVRL